MLATGGHANRLGVRGWFFGGRWGLDRYLYALHRVTGLGLVAYFVLHIVATSSRAVSAEAWEATMARLSGPVFLFGEYLVFLAFAFHAVNGIRLLLAELGLGVGPPIEPIYPYRTSLDVQRPFVWAALVLVALIVVAGSLDFFLWH